MAKIIHTEKLKIVNKIGASDIILFDGLNLAVEEKEWVNVNILHGGGKTTLFKTLLSQVKPTSGKVIYSSKTNLDDYDRDKFIKDNITAVGEYPLIIDTFTVKDWIKFQIELIRPSKYKKRLKEYLKFVESIGINPEKHMTQLKLVEIRKLEVSFSILADTILVICDDIEVGLPKDELTELEGFMKEISKNRAILTISESSVWNKYAKNVIRLNQK